MASQPDASLSLSRLSTVLFSLYCVGTAHGLGLVEKYCLLQCQASESARQVSLLVTCQPARVMQPDRMFAIVLVRHDMITPGSPLQEDQTPRVFPPSVTAPMLIYPSRGFKLMSSRPGVWRPNLNCQLARCQSDRPLYNICITCNIVNYCYLYCTYTELYVIGTVQSISYDSFPVIPRLMEVLHQSRGLLSFVFCHSAISLPDCANLGRAFFSANLSGFLPFGA